MAYVFNVLVITTFRSELVHQNIVDYRLDYVVTTTSLRSLHCMASNAQEISHMFWTVVLV